MILCPSVLYAILYPHHRLTWLNRFPPAGNCLAARARLPLRTLTNRCRHLCRYIAAARKLRIPTTFIPPPRSCAGGYAREHGMAPALYYIPNFFANLFYRAPHLPRYRQHHTPHTTAAYLLLTVIVTIPLV